MPRRTIARSTISFGLVSIPVEIFPATASKSIHFNLLHAKDNSRIQEKVFCIAEDKQVDRSELVHGLQIRKGKYVSFTDEELKKLETGVGQDIEIIQFIPISEVDPVYFVNSYWLGCGPGSAKAYHLLNAAMTNTERAALAKFVMRGKEHLALLRTYGEILMLHTMYYADEIRSSDEIEHGGKNSVGVSELKLAERLINDLSKDEFEPRAFHDEYREKVLKIAEQKAAGQEVTLAAGPKRAKVIDLVSALKRSLQSNTKGRSERRS
ncbi:MAG: Ku protein [Deltaproteobacteria bacterium]|nr:Ku protein [Deltaproteobacteria bacterium]